jgi:hypothetical protein
MTVQRSSSGPWRVTIAGLATGAVGISILWATGQEFPVYPPPGIIILLAGAVFVGLTSWRWTPAVGAFLGLFVTVGFVLEGVIGGGGFENLAGEAGVVRAIGQVVQVAGVVTGLIAGVIATRANYRKTGPSRH